MHDFEPSRKITFLLRQSLAERLPPADPERRRFLNRAVSHELDGERLLTAAEVAQTEGCARNTAQKWAQNNNVLYTGGAYFFTGADIERFRQRPKPGRRWPAENARKSNS